MENITNISLGPLPTSSSYKPFRLYFHQNGIEKNWDLIKVEDSVIAIIYNKTSNKLVLIKQFRPAVYYAAISELGYKPGETIDLAKYPVKLGTTVELCAGYVDKKLSLKDVVKENILEQSGFNVSLDCLEEVMTYRSGVGTTGASQTLFYCEVVDEDKVLKDDGNDNDKIIEVIEISMEEAAQMVKQGTSQPSPPNCIFGVLWFLRNKAGKK